MNFNVLKTTKWAIVAIVMTCIISCSNDEYLELEDKHMTRSSSMNYPEFLTISTFDTKKWTEEDFVAVDKAIERIEVAYSETENRYVYNVLSGKDINISDSLYHCVVKMINHSNTIFAKKENTKITRMKTRSTESHSSDLPDCVPAAIAHMGRNAPTYAEAIKRCDDLFPNWRTTGGVPYSGIINFIKLYTLVTEYNNLNFFGEGNKSVNNYVMVFNNHAVNAYRISKILSNEVIYYHDFSSTGTGSGFILGMEMEGIFVFD